MFSNLGHRMLYSDAFRYASEKLQHQNTVIMNSDCYLENGFEKLNPSILRQGVLYALSRHRDERNPRCSRDECYGYRGSHDAFVFHLNQSLPEMFLREVQYYPNILGAENVLIHHLKHYATFQVRNPCKILRIIHNHCSEYRSYAGSRMNRGGIGSAVARPSGL